MSVDNKQVSEILTQWLGSRLDGPAFSWVEDRVRAIQAGDTKALFLAFGLSPRKVGKADLALTAVELEKANQVRPGWNPQGWTVDQAVRSLFVLSLPATESAALISTLDQLFGVGEVGELVALYQLLPLLPFQEAHVLRAAEGIRTNIKAVFCAVAHQNPFPSEQFSDDQWNQMILKCQFIGVPMSPVVGIDQRANAPLAKMVRDFIHERWAAKRPVPPELWRCIGRFADQEAIEDMKSVLSNGSPLDQQAAALALSESALPTAKPLLDSHPTLAQSITAGEITWDSIDHAGKSAS